MAPTLKNLLTMQKCGMKVKTSTNEVFSFKIFVLGFFGDFPTTAEVALHCTHAGKFRCMRCTVVGERTEGRGGYAFVDDKEETKGEMRVKDGFFVTKTKVITNNKY